MEQLFSFKLINQPKMSLTVNTIFNNQSYIADLSAPIDISIPLKEGTDTVNCFYAPPMQVEPVIAGDFVGSTAQGGPVNFFNIKLNPHGNGTHTECVGHIARPEDFNTERPFPFTINQCLTKFHFFAKLGTLFPIKQPSNGDRVILPVQVKEIIKPGEAEALILRTMPNNRHKLRMKYSGTNPPYLHHEAVAYLVECGVQHLLLDLPSVDREEDGGKLLSHKAFWQYDEMKTLKEGAGRQNCTITELIYVPNEIKDGPYLLNLQITSLEIDASPSKPVIYRLMIDDL